MKIGMVAGAAGSGKMKKDMGMKNTLCPASIGLAVSLALVPWSGALAAEAQVVEQGKTSQQTAPVKPIADLAEAQRVQQALNDFITAYETGNVIALRNKLDPTMVGYQRFLDGVVRDTTAYKQIRIHLLDTQTLAGPDVAVIQTNWEKRFISVSSFQPGLFTGHSTFLFHRGKEGWRIAAFGGDNLFASQSGVLGQLTITPTVIPLASIPAALGFIDIPVQLEVVDPDIAGLGTINLEVVTDKGDRETFALTELTPGRYTRNTLRFGAAVTVVPGNGKIDITGPTTVTLRYLDNNPGDNRPPSVLTRTIRVQ
ncbi:MAG TPA: hypothetical protein VFK88_00500 [Gallionella sp.]|nr:hypothetical protein [Gallionella sp.]